MTFALTSLGSVNPGGWAYATNQKSAQKGLWYVFRISLLFKNRTLKALPSFFDSVNQSPQASLGG